MKNLKITGEGIFWAVIFGFLFIFIPGIFPLGFLGPFGPLIGILLGIYAGIAYGYANTQKRRQKQEIHQYELQKAREYKKNKK